VVPEQGQILVVRMIDDIPDLHYPTYPIETYNIPFKDERQDALERCTLEDLDVAEWIVPPSQSIPIPGLHEHDKSIQPSLMGCTEREPPPVSIMCRTQSPAGMVHLNVWPRRLFVQTKAGPRPTRRWNYPLSSLVYQSVLLFDPALEAEDVMIAGGAERAVVISRLDADDGTYPAVSVAGYVSPNVRTNDQTQRGRLWSDEEDPASPDVHRRAELEAIRGPVRLNHLAPLPVPQEMRLRLSESGLQAVAFDETIARICVSSKDDKRVYVLDYAKAPSLENISADTGLSSLTP
jgi:hypothetical protein